MVKVVLVGFGTVGQGLIEILAEKQAELRQKYGFECQVCGIARKNGKGLNVHHTDEDNYTILDNQDGNYFIKYKLLILTQYR